MASADGGLSAPDILTTDAQTPNAHSYGCPSAQGQLSLAWAFSSSLSVSPLSLSLSSPLPSLSLSRGSFLAESMGVSCSSLSLPVPSIITKAENQRSFCSRQISTSLCHIPSLFFPPPLSFSHPAFHLPPARPQSSFICLHRMPETRERCEKHHLFPLSVVDLFLPFILSSPPLHLFRL